MFKKIFAIATVMCVIPMMASAASWKLTTRAMSQGGVIDSNNMTGQTVLNGTIAKTYADATTPTVTVTPAAGFKISKLSENGVISVPAVGPYTSTNTGTSNFSLQATFARVPFAITATAGAGGSVNKTSYPVVYSGTQSPVKSFVFTPNPGQFVSNVTVTGAGAVSQNLNAVTGELITSFPAAANVKVKTNITTVGTSSVTVAGVFGGSATATPVVPSNQCESCHKSQGVGTGVYAAWSSSTHKTGNVQCYACHVGSNTGAHPGATVTAANCESCHTATLSTTTHPVDLTASKCLSCHNSHDPAAGIPSLAPSAHPAVTLYTFEEIGMQMASGQKVPVQVDANGKGMPYSPKQTCGTSGCHVKNGVDYTYDKIADHSFHSAQGRNEYVDSSDGKFDATKTKPFTQSGAMVGKW